MMMRTQGQSWRHSYVLAAIITILTAVGASAAPDLSSSTKSVDPTLVPRGTPLTYTIVVRNFGVDPATSVTVSDVFDICVDDTAFDPVNDVTGGIAIFDPPSHSLQVVLPDLAPGSQQTVTITGLYGGQQGQCCNAAVIQCFEIPGGQPTNAACVEVSGCSAFAQLEPAGPICAFQDLFLDASATVVMGCPGSVSYEWYRDGNLYDVGVSPLSAVTAVSPGGSIVFGVEVVCDADPTCVSLAEQTVNVCEALADIQPASPVFPQGTDFVLDGSGSGGTACSGTATYQWDEGGSPIPGANQAQYTVPGSHPAGLFSFGLTITTNEGCSANATVSVEITPPNGPDFSSSRKIVSPGSPVTAGTPLTYTLLISNSGTASATGVVVSDILDACLDDGAFNPATDVTGGAASYDAPSRTLQIALSDLFPGTQQTVTITGLTAAQIGQCCNSAMITCNEIPSGQPTNTACVDVTDPSCTASIQFVPDGPVTIWPGDDLRLYAPATVTGCPGSVTYTWYRDDPVVPIMITVTDQAVDVTASQLAPGPHLYRVEVSCDADPTCMNFDEMTFIVSGNGCSATADIQPPNPAYQQGADFLLDGAGSNAAGCTGGLDYQWYEGGMPIPGADQPTYTIPAVHPAGSFVFGLAVTCQTEACAGSATVDVTITTASGPDLSTSTLEGFPRPTPTPGRNVLFRMSVENSGSAAASNVVVTQTLPDAGCLDDAGFDPAAHPCQVSVWPGPAAAVGYDGATRQITVRFDSVAPGETHVITVTGLVAAGPQAACCSQATLSCTEAAPVPTDDPSTPTADDATCLDMTGDMPPWFVLRNDSYPLSSKEQIFSSNTCLSPRWTDTSLDPEGPDCTPDVGECDGEPDPGSHDDDDFYVDWLQELEPNVLYDTSRPLIFYQVEDLRGGGGPLMVVKDASDAGFTLVF